MGPGGSVVCSPRPRITRGGEYLPLLTGPPRPCTDLQVCPCVPSAAGLEVLYIEACHVFCRLGRAQAKPLFFPRNLAIIVQNCFKKQGSKMLCAVLYLHIYAYGSCVRKQVLRTKSRTLVHRCRSRGARRRRSTGFASASSRSRPRLRAPIAATHQARTMSWPGPV